MRAAETPHDCAGGASAWQSLTGATLSVVVLSELAFGLGAGDVAKDVAIMATVVAMAAFLRTVRGMRLVFLGISFVVGIACLVLLPEPLAVLRPALSQASFITAFFCALAALQTVVRGSPAMHRAAIFLSSQSPGRRYLSLALGTQLFTLLINYGSIGLLGSMAATSARHQPDQAHGALLLRRMLQAVQCGFAAAIIWSPFGFAVVLSVSQVPGAELLPVIQACLMVSALMIVTGWLLDRRWKSAQEPGQLVSMDAGSLLPLAVILVAVALPAIGLEMAFGLPTAIALLALVPLLAMGWILWETPRPQRAHRLGHEAHGFVTRALPGFSGELVLLGTAGFLGNAGGVLLSPLIVQSGLDISGLSPRLVVLLPLVVIPLLGQIGMNPVLSATLLPYLLPEPGSIGLSPIALAVALIAGWAFAIITSPFTASVAIAARLAGVPTRVAGLQWNGIWFLIAAPLTALWLQLLA